MVTNNSNPAQPPTCYEQMSRSQLLEVIETQKRVINAVQTENQWYHNVIFHPGFNETHMRILVETTPPEMRMGLVAECPEKKIYLPAIAEKVHASEKTVSKKVRSLASIGAFSYRTETDPDTQFTRAYLRPLPPVQAPDTLMVDDNRRGGGSTWEDGKRVKRCKNIGCGSTNLVKVSQVICADCGTVQSEKTITPINRDTDSQSDTRFPNGSDSQSDTGYSESNETPEIVESHLVCDLPTDGQSDRGLEIPKLPPRRVYTGGIEVELLPPPMALQQKKIWVVWRYEPVEGREKPAKVPYQVKHARAPQQAKVNDPATWGTYEQASKMYEDAIAFNMAVRWDGIGLMCDGSFTFTDWDHCIADGKCNQQIWDQAQRVNSWMELSPGGDGIHCIAWGTVPAGRKCGNIEMYSGGEGKGRFLTWTGQHIVGTPAAIEDQQEQITALYEEITPTSQRTIDQTGASPTCVLVACESDRTPEEIEESAGVVLERVSNAANGAKFRALWDGDMSGYSSPSNADLALCGLLAHWTDDAAVIDSLFRQSKLYRPKWDRKARSGETYGEGTIRVAIEGRAWKSA